MASMIDNLLGRVRDPMVSQGLLALGGSMMQAGAQGMPTGAAFGQGLQAYQQAAQGYQDRQREDQKYQREQELQALIDEAIANPTEENLRKVAVAGGPQTAASVVNALIRPATRAQVPDVIEIAERYKSDPSFKQFYDNSYRPQTYGGNTVVALPGGGFGIQQTGSKGGTNVIPIPGAPAQYSPTVNAAVAGAEAGARAGAEADVARQAKAPAYESFKIAKANMEESISRTPTGGFMGATGQLSRVTDYQKVRQFDNRREQISTELRTLFRIPGEGTLSDREQMQYGLQLPDIRNDADVNRQILADLDARIQARLSAPAQAPNAAAGGAPAATRPPLSSFGGR